MLKNFKTNPPEENKRFLAFADLSSYHMGFTFTMSVINGKLIRDLDNQEIRTSLDFYYIYLEDILQNNI